MIGYHLAVSFLGFRTIFRDHKADLRWLAIGAVLSDVVDLPLGTVVLSSIYGSSELWMHAPLVIVGIGAVVLTVTRRTNTRRWLVVVTIGMLFHLLADGVWTDTELFWWPVTGDFVESPTSFWDGIGTRILTSPWLWISEALGWLYLVGLGWRTQFFHRAEIRQWFWRTGQLPMTSVVSL